MIQPETRISEEEDGFWTVSHLWESPPLYIVASLKGTRADAERAATKLKQAGEDLRKEGNDGR